jgi:hypothetical protein
LLLLRLLDTPMRSGEEAISWVSQQAGCSVVTCNCMVVARHAQALLEEERPDVLEEAIQMLAPLKEHYPDLTTDEGNYPFTECTNFADSIIPLGYDWQFHWHFIDTPYMIEGGDIDDFPDFVLEDEDNVHALGALTALLKNE